MANATRIRLPATGCGGTSSSMRELTHSPTQDTKPRRSRRSPRRRGSRRASCTSISASKAALYRAVLDRVAGDLERVFTEPTGRYGVDLVALLAVARVPTPMDFGCCGVTPLANRSFKSSPTRCRKLAVSCARSGLSAWTPADALEWAAHAVVGYLLEAVLAWIDFGQPAEDARFVRATRASLAAGVRAWASE